jgi:hypothetical protein
VPGCVGGRRGGIAAAAAPPHPSLAGPNQLVETIDGGTVRLALVGADPAARNRAWFTTSFVAVSDTAGATSEAAMRNRRPEPCLAADTFYGSTIAYGPDLMFVGDAIRCHQHLPIAKRRTLNAAEWERGTPGRVDVTPIVCSPSGRIAGARKAPSSC